MKYQKLEIEKMQIPTEMSPTFETVLDLLQGDLDLTLANIYGLNLFTGDETYISLPKGTFYKNIAILQGIAALDDNAHLAAYEENDLDHDGGDDLDYGGTFLGLLADLLILNKDLLTA